MTVADSTPSASAGSTTETTPLLTSEVNRDEDNKPLPKWQVFLLCYACIIEPIAFFSIFPFVNEMIAATGSVEEADVGFLSGVIESLFSLTQTVFMLLWGRAADRYGRKPVLLWSLAGVALASTFFGLSTTVWEMIVWRCVAGVFAGITVTVRTMLSENSTPKTQARAFSLFAFTQNMGICLGPLIGGAFSRPSEQYPSLFGSFTLFESYPYLLPCIACGALAAGATLLNLFFLHETLPVESPKDGVPEPIPIREIVASPGVVPVLVLFQYAMLLGLSFTAVMPVFFYTAIPLGGFSFSPPQIALYIAGCGISQAIWLLIAFPILQKRIGTGNLLRGCGFAWPIAFACFPLQNALLRHGESSVFWTITPFTIFGISGVSMAFTGVQLALNDVSPSPHALGTLNGLALSLTSAVRAATPATFASIFAYGVKYQIFYGYLIWVVLILTAIGFSVCLRWLPAKAEGRMHPTLTVSLEDNSADRGA